MDFGNENYVHVRDVNSPIDIKHAISLFLTDFNLAFKKPFHLY